MEQIKVENRDWPEARQFNKSIRLQFCAYISLIIVFLMLITGYLITNMNVKAITRAAAEKLLVQARSYSAPAGKQINSVAGPDILLLNDICQKLSKDNQDIYWAGIVDKSGKFIAHTDISKVVSAQIYVPVTGANYKIQLRQGESFSSNGDTLQIDVPIIDNGVYLGTLAAASSSRQIIQARRDSIMTVAVITFIMIIIGVPLVTLLLNKKLRPIAIMAEKIKNVDVNQMDFDIAVRSKNEVGYLSETLNVMGKKLHTAQIEMIEKERMSRDLEIAREIQSSLLPPCYPSGENFRFAGVYRSAKEVGGDYYDFINLDQKRLAFLVADVSGKSLPGMLVMLMIRDIIKRVAPTRTSPSELLCQVNQELIGNIRKGMFVTMFYGILDTSSGEFSFASAGHNPLIILREKDNNPVLIEARGYPLGIMPPSVFEKRIENKRITLSSGDNIIQYTDGVNEAHNAADEEYGLESMLKAIATAKAKDANELVGAVLTDQTAFVGSAPQFDDITLIAMKWNDKTSIKEIGQNKEFINAS